MYDLFCKLYSDRDPEDTVHKYICKCYCSILCCDCKSLKIRTLDKDEDIDKGQNYPLHGGGVTLLL